MSLENGPRCHKAGSLSLFGRAIRPRSVGASIGVVIVAINIVATIAGPMWAPYSETAIVGDIFEGFSERSPLGTDYLGRDLLSRVLYGARLTIGIAFLATVLAFTVGVIGGLLAAVTGGWVDLILSRFVDALMAIPSLVLALIILTGYGSSYPTLIVVMAVASATRPFRLARAVGMDIAVLDFVDSARARGEKRWWLMTREVLPNAWPPLLVEFGLRFTFATLFLSSLSFLGLGVEPPAADWGLLVRENSQALILGELTPLVPALAIGVLIVGINLIIDSNIDTIDSLESEEGVR